MIIGYYDWNESIAYPLTATVDTNVTGFSLSALIVGASISLPAEVVDVIGADLYIAEVVRDRSNSAVITVANTPTLGATPVFAIDFRVVQGTDRFVVLPGVVRGTLGARVAAFLVIADNAFIPKLTTGTPVTFAAIARLDPGVIRVADRGNAHKITVINSVKRADVVLPRVDHAMLPTTPITLDQLSGAPVDAVTLSPSGAQYQLVHSTGTTYVAMPSSVTSSVGVQAPRYISSINPKVYIGRTANQQTKSVTNVPTDFSFIDWINNHAIYSVISHAVVYIDGVRTSIGGADGIPRSALSAGFQYHFTSPGVHLVTIAATKTALIGLVQNEVSYITFSATITVQDAAAYYQSSTTIVTTSTPGVVAVAVANYELSQSALMVETHNVTRPTMAPLVIAAALGGDYGAEDTEARNSVAAEVITPVLVAAAPVFVAGKNLRFAFTPVRNTITPSVAAGAHITVPYVGYAVPALVSCSGALRTLFGANPDADGNVNIIAGAGVTVIPEPSAHRVTVIIEDPRAAASGKKC